MEMGLVGVALWDLAGSSRCASSQRQGAPPEISAPFPAYDSARETPKSQALNLHHERWYLDLRIILPTIDSMQLSPEYVLMFHQFFEQLM
jgi:hypothetical protein